MALHERPYEMIYCKYSMIDSKVAENSRQLSQPGIQDLGEYQSNEECESWKLNDLAAGGF